MTNHFGLVFLIFLTLGVSWAAFLHDLKHLPQKEVHPNAGLNISEICERYGYPLESHQVETEDGYILTLHRIPAGVADRGVAAEGRPVAFFMHGLFSSSVDFINIGPGKSVALDLADAGYDVWLGNQRGNAFSRKHLTLDPDVDKAAFYNFTFHEVGKFDLPAILNYVLQETGQPDLTYVGHSQGCTDFFVLTSVWPEFNSKINLMVALAPAVYMGALPNPIMRLMADNLDLLMNLAVDMDVYEFLPHYDSLEGIAEDLCTNQSDFHGWCELFIELIVGFDNQIEPDFFPVIATNAPAGASISQVWHFFQGYLSQKFLMYNLGEELNLQTYGQKTPPEYNLAEVTAPVSIYYAANDALVATEDIAQLVGILPNVIHAVEVDFERFNHLDFIWAKDVDVLLNQYVLEDIMNRK